MESTTMNRRAPCATIELPHCTCGEHRRLGRKGIAPCVVQAESIAAHLVGQLNLYVRDRDLLPKLVRACEKLVDVIRTDIPTSNVTECTVAHYEQLAAELRWHIEHK